jgi:bifunctional DNA-binding transcriptional regulator/antitoxin component of YhaV-PrlF toxin-antitoxin module
MKAQATVTSRGRITVPREVRLLAVLCPGDHLLFESDAKGIRERPVRTCSPFAKYRGIGNPGMASGWREIARWLRDLRGR